MRSIFVALNKQYYPFIVSGIGCVNAKQSCHPMCALCKHELLFQRHQLPDSANRKESKHGVFLSRAESVCLPVFTHGMSLKLPPGKGEAVLPLRKLIREVNHSYKRKGNDPRLNLIYRPHSWASHLHTGLRCSALTCSLMASIILE